MDIWEHEVHDAIEAFSRLHKEAPIDIAAGYKATLAMMSFCGTAYTSKGLSLLTPFGWLPISFEPKMSSELWEIM